MLLPICFLAGVLNYLDRTNLTYAALELNSDLGFGPVDYGIGAGASRSLQLPSRGPLVDPRFPQQPDPHSGPHSCAGAFYLGYGVAHIPSTFLTMRLGARWWYSTMTLSWGIVATSAAAIQDRTGLVLQRFFLGITEAGAACRCLYVGVRGRAQLPGAPMRW